MRLSEIQQDTLFVLYAISQQGITTPIPCLGLLDMINASRPQQIFPSNFRTSCHTLVKHGLLEMCRNPKTIKLAFSLTEKGMDAGRAIHQKRTGNKADQS